MTSIISEYLEYHDKYTNIHGFDKTLVLMQVGGFYEAYATQNKGPNLQLLESLTDIIMTKRNTSINEATIRHYYMWGFPIAFATKYFEILTNEGFCLIIIDQMPQSLQKSEIERKVVGIYSKETFTDNMSQ